MVGIWAKVGGAVKKGAGTTKNVLLLVPKALIYPIKKPFASLGEMKHDATVSLKEAVGMDVPEKEKKHDPPIETTEASKNLGVKMISYKGEKIKLLASRALTGDMPYLTPEQLGKMKELNLNTVVPNKSSSTMKSSGNVKPEEFNITNPMGFPFHNEMTFPAKSIQLLQGIKEQAEGLESAFNFKDVSPGEEIKQLSTSTVKRNKEGGRPI